MTQHNVHRVNMSPGELNSIIEKIEEAVGDETPGDVLIACIAIALEINNPEMSITELADGIKQVSQYVCMIATPAEADETRHLDRKKMN